MAAALKRIAASRAQNVYMLTDSTKFGRVTAATIFPLEGAVIVTERLADARYREYTEIKVV